MIKNHLSLSKKKISVSTKITLNPLRFDIPGIDLLLISKKNHVPNFFLNQAHIYLGKQIKH